MANILVWRRPEVWESKQINILSKKCSLLKVFFSFLTFFFFLMFQDSWDKRRSSGLVFINSFRHFHFIKLERTTYLKHLFYFSKWTSFLEFEYLNFCTKIDYRMKYFEAKWEMSSYLARTKISSSHWWRRRLLKKSLGSS